MSQSELDQFLAEQTEPSTNLSIPAAPSATKIEPSEPTAKPPHEPPAAPAPAAPFNPYACPPPAFGMPFGAIPPHLLPHMAQIMQNGSFDLRSLRLSSFS